MAQQLGLERVAHDGVQIHRGAGQKALDAVAHAHHAGSQPVGGFPHSNKAGVDGGGGASRLPHQHRGVPLLLHRAPFAWRVRRRRETTVLELFHSKPTVPLGTLQSLLVRQLVIEARQVVPARQLS